MSNVETVGIKEAINLNERFLVFTKLVRLNTTNLKALKLCAKFVRCEFKRLKKLKSPIDENQFYDLQWRYIDLGKVVKSLRKTKRVEEMGKALEELNRLVSATENQNAELKAKLNPVAGIIDADKISDILGGTARKISSAVSDKVSALKKTLTGESEKSE